MVAESFTYAHSRQDCSLGFLNLGTVAFPAGQFFVDRGRLACAL